MNQDSVANLLREARRLSGLNQSELAAASRIAQPNISAYESGKRSPTIRTMLALLNACDVELCIRPKK